MKTTIPTLFNLMAALFVAQAAPAVYFGEDLNHSQPPQQPDTPTPLASYPHSSLAASRFLARLTGVATETFEAFSPGSSPSVLAFGADSATLSGSREVFKIPAGTYNGVYPISSNQTLILQSLTPGFFQIQFSTPQAAFGFYATDIEVAQLQIGLVTSGGARTNILVPSTLPQWSGGVLFFGVIDEENPFTRVEFMRVGDQGDGFGFDDMTVGRLDQVHPEPATLGIDRDGPYPDLLVTGTVGATYRIEYALALPSTNWLNLTNLMLPSSPFGFLDPGSISNQASRFYRAIGVD